MFRLVTYAGKAKFQFAVNRDSERFGVDRIENLSLREASSLIDELKRNAPAMRA